MNDGFLIVLKTRYQSLSWRRRSLPPSKTLPLGLGKIEAKVLGVGKAAPIGYMPWWRAAASRNFAWRSSMNRFRNLGSVKYSGRIKVCKLLLNTILQDHFPEHKTKRPAAPALKAAAMSRMKKNLLD